MLKCVRGQVTTYILTAIQLKNVVNSLVFSESKMTKTKRFCKIIAMVRTSSKILLNGDHQKHFFPIATHVHILK